MMKGVIVTLKARLSLTKAQRKAHDSNLPDPPQGRHQHPGMGAVDGSRETGQSDNIGHAV